MIPRLPGSFKPGLSIILAFHHSNKWFPDLPISWFPGSFKPGLSILPAFHHSTKWFPDFPIARLIQTRSFNPSIRPSFWRSDVDPWTLAPLNLMETKKATKFAAFSSFLYRGWKYYINTPTSRVRRWRDRFWFLLLLTELRVRRL